MPGYEATSTPLHLTIDPGWDLVEALAYGTPADGLGDERYVGLVEQRLALVLDPGLEVAIGFVLQDADGFDVREHDETEELWHGPRFRVPVLGLMAATVGEALLAIRGRFEPGEPTADAMHFHQAMGERDPAKAVVHWRLALEAGDMKSHYALGYTLFELGRVTEAYDHLRHYTELVPANAWAWCWFGQAAEACGQPGEARRAYERAVAVGDDETDADERLAALER